MTRCLIEMYHLDSRSILDAAEKSTESNNSKVFESAVETRKTSHGIAATDHAGIPMSGNLDEVTKQVLTTEQSNVTALSDNLTTLINEQHRQNYLLQQVLAAINTTNALLTQLVQR